MGKAPTFKVGAGAWQAHGQLPRGWAMHMTACSSRKGRYVQQVGVTKGERAGCMQRAAGAAAQDWTPKALPPRQHRRLRTHVCRVLCYFCRVQMPCKACRTGGPGQPHVLGCGSGYARDGHGKSTILKTIPSCQHKLNHTTHFADFALAVTASAKVLLAGAFDSQRKLRQPSQKLKQHAPKSHSFRMRSGVTRMLAGLRSRWMICGRRQFAWAWAPHCALAPPTGLQATAAALG